MGLWTRMAWITIGHDLGAVVTNLFCCCCKLRKVLNLKSQLSSTGYVKIRFGSPNKLGYITHYPEYLCVCTAHTHPTFWLDEFLSVSLIIRILCTGLLYNITSVFAPMSCIIQYLCHPRLWENSQPSSALYRDLIFFPLGGQRKWLALLARCYLCLT